ncbi:hypothetical protein CR155_08130 [Pollutimonas nitritireducens]|uniref:Transmembrane protein n=1 Tax=Pollutimonas nitritireducens TaxID=2045209 RepID=A0A2N4UH83_9BURK|nr:DUF924 family protein [Pollutimonas nitritireducens]PLC54369.1 hypothetical protein CR155_08130 [Pollutimonas nitritireducens]
MTIQDSVHSESPNGILSFWQAAGPPRWFKKDTIFDQDFRNRFLPLHLAAARRELDHWQRSADGGLALLILLDQFPRNAFRDTAHMFATDELARYFATAMVGSGLDQDIEPALRVFCYLPFEHSESLADQERSLALQVDMDPSTRAFAEEHHRIIARFGRFPHRNRLLGRITTAAEQEYLEAGGFAG